MEKKKFQKKHVLVDEMTKEEFVKSWVETGMPPDDPYMRKLTKNGIADAQPVKAELRTKAVAEKMWKIREDRKALVTILRSPKKIGECLDEHNMWRRGEGKYREGGCEPPYSGYMVGKLLEGASGYLCGRDTEVML